MAGRAGHLTANALRLGPGAAGDYELWIINRDGSGLQQVTAIRKGGAHYSPWSPDGSTIAYSTHAPKNDCVMVQPDKSWNDQKLHVPARAQRRKPLF